MAEAIVEVLAKMGGVMTTADLASHVTTFPEPISTNYRGVDVWEIPPNGQGLTALIALNILEGFDVKAMGHNSPQALHTMVETMRLAFADTQQYISDPDIVPVPTSQLLSKAYAAERRALINPHTVFGDGTAAVNCAAQPVA